MGGGEGGEWGGELNLNPNEIKLKLTLIHMWSYTHPDSVCLVNNS